MHTEHLGNEISESCCELFESLPLNWMDREEEFPLVLAPAWPDNILRGSAVAQ